jgi:hypothetical protein
MRTLLHLVEQRRRVVDDKTRFTNRLGYALKQYFPQALDWFDHTDTIMFCDFLTRWPTLLQVKRARASSVRAFFSSHNVPDGHFKFPHLWPPQTPPGRTVEVSVV